MHVMNTLNKVLSVSSSGGGGGVATATTATISDGGGGIIMIVPSSNSNLSDRSGSGAGLDTSTSSAGRKRRTAAAALLKEQQQQQQQQSSLEETAGLSHSQLSQFSQRSNNKRKSSSPSSNASLTFMQELWASTDLLFSSKLTWLLLLGPLAVWGDVTGTFGEAMCFACAGIALIPCAERLSFVTEQVAEHTNGTIGALLNATFGNAPELLISVAALRSGYYRVVQLAMLGSMLTNLLLVFGLSCFIGGLRFQVQSLRLVSGNVNVVMLYVATAGSLFPAALSLAGQYKPFETITSSSSSNHHDEDAQATTAATTMAIKVPTPDEITFSRVNAAVMLLLYLMFLIFQLETHKDEFDDHVVVAAAPARRNLVCLSYWTRFEEFAKMGRSIMFESSSSSSSGGGGGGGASRFATPVLFRRRISKPQLKVVTALPTKEMISLLGKSKSSDHRPLVAVELIQQQHDGDFASTDEEDDDDDENNVKLSCPNDKVDAVLYDDILLSGNNMPSAMTTATSVADADASTTTTGFNQRRRQPMEENGGAYKSPKKLRPSRFVNSSFRWSHKSKDSDRTLTENCDDDDDVGDLDGVDLEEEHVFDIEMDDLGGIDEYDHNNDDVSHDHHTLHKQATGGGAHGAGPLISLRIGILWLFIITLCISAMSDILVDTIDGFAQRLNLSQVFTSMVVIPFFSNVAEQVSAFLFAFRNEMDLCIGVTVGSAIQILTFVLPGSVLIGMMMDRSMTLYSYGYETVCLAFSVIVVGSVLQNGTTNWLTGVMLVGIYVMLASGIWFHELEDLTVDAEMIFHNSTAGAN